MNKVCGTSPFIPISIFVLQFLFCSFCSAIFVLLFLFHYFCSTIFCSTIFVWLTFLHLHLGSPSPNGQESPPIFCSAIFVLLTFLYLHLGSPSPNGQESPPIFVLPDRCYPFKVQTLNEQSLWNIPFYTHLIFVLQFLFCSFCSAIFVPLFLFHNFLFHNFLFHNFCLADLFALALGVPVTQWPRVSTNFCSAIFVPLTILHLHLGSPSPNSQESPPIFVLPDRCYPFKVQTLNEQSLWNIPFYTHLIFVLQFLFHYFCSAIFCSAIFVPLTFLHLHLGSPSPNGQESPPIFVPQF